MLSITASLPSFLLDEVIKYAGISSQLSNIHRDQFLKQYKSKWLPKYDFPVILSQEQDMLEIFLSNVDIAQAKDVEALIDLVQSRL